MATSKKVFSSSIGGPWQSSSKPDSRRKMNVKSKSKKGKK